MSKGSYLFLVIMALVISFLVAIILNPEFRSFASKGNQSEIYISIGISKAYSSNY